MTDEKPVLTAPEAPLDRIEWRPQGKPHNNRCRFVPYLSAATVAGLLDGWVGADCWEDVYEVGQVGRSEVMWCRLTVHFDGRTVVKTDLGKASNFEGEKGAVSDAFKRAATLKLGVGRNVYDLPTVWAPCRTDNGGNPWPTDETLPAIAAELESRGVSAEAAQRTAVDEGHAVEGDESPANPAPDAEALAAAEDALDELEQAAPEFYAAEVQPKRETLVRWGANGPDHLDRMVSRLVKEQGEWEQTQGGDA